MATGEWAMPAETAPHERTWMAFPPGGYTLGTTEAESKAAREAWSAVANAVSEFEPVSMLVTPGERRAATRLLSGEIELIDAELDDAWMRDIGPTFVVRDGEQGRELGAVDWVFNGWGQQEWASWKRDAAVGATVASLSGAEPIGSPLVNEGGGINVDGRGSVLVTETVQRDPLRNPRMTRAAIESELSLRLGVTNVVWLPRGLYRDAKTFGTKGHVDIVASFPMPGTMIVHAQPNESHPDHAIMQQIREVLDRAVDVDGKRWDIVEVPAPSVVKDDIDFVDFSYINHLAVNGGVIACGFNDPNDDRARGILSDVYPGRDVVTVDATEIFARGGGIHCITQQQPKL